MTSAELRHNLTSVSTYRPLTAGLNLYHSFEIADSALDPAEMQNLSLTSLREADFGTQLELEISCAIGRFRVASDRLARFPFVSNLLTQLRETSHAAKNISRAEAVNDVGDSLILLYHMILDHGPTPRKKPYICLQKISLELTISRAIHELARGINALDVYDILETSPPLPLQMCLDDLIGQLFCHLTESFPALFGAHSTPLQKNAQFLSSSFDSMLRIMNASADGKRKAKADQAYKRLVDNARSRSGIPSGEAYLRALDESRGDSGSTIKNATAAVGCDRDDLARSLTRRMYCVWMKLLPQAKRQGTPVALPDAEEIAETYDSAPETTAEEHAFIESTEFCDSLDADNRSREDDTEIASSPLRISSPAESILEMDSPPTSPLSSPFNTQEPMDTELLTGSACSCLDRVEQGQAQDEILEFPDDGL